MSQKCHSILRDKSGRLLAHAASVSHDFPGSHMIPEHDHPEDQLLYACCGVMTLRTPHGLWVVPPLRAVWIPARIPHSVSIPAPVSMRTLYFLPGLVKKLPSRCFVMNVSPLLTQLILHACNFKRLHRTNPKQRRILGMIVDQLQDAGTLPLQLPHPSDPRALRIVDALVADPGDERTLQQLCKACGGSKRTIQRLFLTETKMSFAKWRQQFRILHGMRLVASGEKVTAAALASGYNSPSAFISMFRKQLGTTPNRYFSVSPEPSSGPSSRS
jgi:AraC-like DNA-binding protein